MTERAARCLIKRRGRTGRLESAQDARSKLNLLVRKLLLVDEVLVTLSHLLLFQRLNLSTCLQLCAGESKPLLVLLLSQSAQRLRRS